MNKSELIEKVADQSGLTNKKARIVLETMLDAITGSLQNEDKTTLKNFGSFEVVYKKPKSGVNPRNGEKIWIPGRRLPKFRPSKYLQENL